jgi:hypothetical protein
MPAKRAPRRDDEVDKTRTINWFRCLGDHFGTYRPREIQRYVNPKTLGKDRNGEKIRNGKFMDYSRGLRVPLDSMVMSIEMMVPGSSWELNHVLWTVLRAKGSIKDRAHDWIRQLVPSVQAVVMGPNNEIIMKGNRHSLGPLERRASIDSLTALTIIFFLCVEEENSEMAWLYALSIFRVLLIIGTELDERTIAERVFNLYVDRIFSKAAHEGMALDAGSYQYREFSLLLTELAEQLRVKYGTYRDRRMPSFYALQIIEGKFMSHLQGYFSVPTKSN